MASREISQKSDWLGDEPALGAGLRRVIRRTFRRGPASWFVWVPLAVGVALYGSARSTRRRAFEATVVLRLTEGRLAAAGGQLGAGMVRAYVQDRGFSSDHLLQIMRRHPRAFSDAATEPAESVQEMRAGIEVSISGNDFVEDRRPDDPPRSARIAITFHAGDPELAIAVARELAQVVVSSTLGIEKQQLERNRAAAAAALAQAEHAYDSEAAQAGAADGAGSGGPGSDELAEVARQELRRTVALAGATSLASRAGEDDQTLRFDVIDMGTAPPRHTRSFFLQQLAADLLVALLVGWLLAGTFDPRILDRSDLEDLGLAPLGELPRLPPRRRAVSGVSARSAPRPSTSA